VCACVWGGVCVCMRVYVCTCVACLTGTHITLVVPGLDPDFVPPESPPAVIFAVDLEVDAAFGFKRLRPAGRKNEFIGSCSSSSDSDRHAHVPSVFGFRSFLGGITTANGKW